MFYSNTTDSVDTVHYIEKNEERLNYFSTTFYNIRFL